MIYVSKSRNSVSLLSHRDNQRISSRILATSSTRLCRNVCAAMITFAGCSAAAVMRRSKSIIWAGTKCPIGAPSVPWRVSSMSPASRNPSESHTSRSRIFGHLTFATTSTSSATTARTVRRPRLPVSNLSRWQGRWRWRQRRWGSYHDARFTLEDRSSRVKH